MGLHLTIHVKKSMLFKLEPFVHKYMYMGVHRFTPNLAVNGEAGWPPSIVRRKTVEYAWSILRFWNRMTKLEKNRLNKKTFNCDWNICVSKNVKNWAYEVNQIFSDCNLQLDAIVLETQQIFCNVMKSSLTCIKLNGIARSISNQN